MSADAKTVLSQLLELSSKDAAWVVQQFLAERLDGAVKPKRRTAKADDDEEPKAKRAASWFSQAFSKVASILKPHIKADKEAGETVEGRAAMTVTSMLKEEGSISKESWEDVDEKVVVAAYKRFKADPPAKKPKTVSSRSSVASDEKPKKAAAKEAKEVKKAAAAAHVAAEKAAAKAAEEKAAKAAEDEAEESEMDAEGKADAEDESHTPKFAPTSPPYGPADSTLEMPTLALDEPKVERKKLKIAVSKGGTAAMSKAELEYELHDASSEGHAGKVWLLDAKAVDDGAGAALAFKGLYDPATGKLVRKVENPFADE